MRLPHHFTIGADHPSLPGHFPGHPLVPGVVLLEAAIAPLLRAGRRVALLEAAKFLAPVRFGEQVVVTFEEDSAGNVGCNATVADVSVMRCRLRLAVSA